MLHVNFLTDNKELSGNKELSNIFRMNCRVNYGTRGAKEVAKGTRISRRNFIEHPIGRALRSSEASAPSAAVASCSFCYALFA